MNLKLSLEVSELPLAFVLINAEIGTEDEVLKELMKLENVKEAYAVYGVYDIVAKIKAGSIDELKDVVYKSRKLKDVRTTVTMIVIEGP